jgi:hypothetical protein
MLSRVSGIAKKDQERVSGALRSDPLVACPSYCLYQESIFLIFSLPMVV